MTASAACPHGDGILGGGGVNVRRAARDIRGRPDPRIGGPLPRVGDDLAAADGRAATADRFRPALTNAGRPRSGLVRTRARAPRPLLSSGVPNGCGCLCARP